MAQACGTQHWHRCATASESVPVVFKFRDVCGWLRCTISNIRALLDSSDVNYSGGAEAAAGGCFYYEVFVAPGMAGIQVLLAFWCQWPCRCFVSNQARSRSESASGSSGRITARQVLEVRSGQVSLRLRSGQIYLILGRLGPPKSRTIMRR